MDQQEISDQLEIQQLCARYMMLSARKDNDHWREVFTEDGVYHAFGTPYGLEHFPMLLKSAPPGQYIGNPPIVEFHGDSSDGSLDRAEVFGVHIVDDMMSSRAETSQFDFPAPLSAA